MARIGESADLFKCSFCGKSQKQVQQLIAGPGVYICDECVELCNEIIEERAGRAGRRRRRRLRPARSRARSSPSSRSTSSARSRRSARCRSRSTTTTSASAPTARSDGRAACRRHRDRQEQHPADRPDRLRQDLSRPDPRQATQRPVRGRRRHRPHRGRLRRRRRREHPPQAHPGRRLRRQARRDRHHLHRRGRQDRPQGREPVDHARRLRRGRAAGAPEDPRGHGRLGAAAGRSQAPAPGVHPDRHDERAVHRRRRVRRSRRHRLVPRRQARHRLRCPAARQGPTTSTSSARCCRKTCTSSASSPSSSVGFRSSRSVSPLDQARAHGDPHRAEERARQAVPAHVRARRRRARVRAGRPRGRSPTSPWCRKTGARGLRAILEDVLGPIMFEIPSAEDVDKVVVTQAAVARGRSPDHRPAAEAQERLVCRRAPRRAPDGGEGRPSDERTASGVATARVSPRDRGAPAAARSRHPVRGSRGRPRADPSTRRRRAVAAGTARRSPG